MTPTSQLSASALRPPLSQSTSQNGKSFIFLIAFDQHPLDLMDFQHGFQDWVLPSFANRSLTFSISHLSRLLCQTSGSKPESNRFPKSFRQSSMWIFSLSPSHQCSTEPWREPSSAAFSTQLSSRPHHCFYSLTSSLSDQQAQQQPLAYLSCKQFPICSSHIHTSS